jgi:hypothetical protein
MTGWIRIAALVLLGGLCAVPGSMARTHGADIWRITLERCVGIQPGELSRLLHIEMRELLTGHPGKHRFDIRIDCRVDRTRIRIVDATTQKGVERDIPPFDPLQPGGARILAITISQLFFATWSELLTPKPQPEPQPVEETPPVSVSTSDDRANWSASLASTVSIHDLEFPQVFYGARLHVHFSQSERWGVFLALGLDVSRAERSIGGVWALMPGAWLGSTWTPLRAGDFSLQASVALGVRYIRLQGDPGQSEVNGQVVEGLVGEGVLSLGPGFYLGSMRLGLNLEAGGTYPKVAGLVDDDRAVQVLGPWLGLNLALQAAF